MNRLQIVTSYFEKPTNTIWPLGHLHLHPAHYASPIRESGNGGPGVMVVPLKTFVDQILGTHFLIIFYINIIYCYFFDKILDNLTLFLSSSWFSY